MKQWVLYSLLLILPPGTGSAWPHSPLGCLWLTQIPAGPTPSALRKLIKYRVLPSGVIHGSWSELSLLTVSGRRSAGDQSPAVPGPSPLCPTRWVTKISVGPLTRVSPLFAKRAKWIVFPSAEIVGS